MRLLFSRRADARDRQQGQHRQALGPHARPCLCADRRRRRSHTLHRFLDDGKAVTAVSDKGSLWKFETLEGHLIGTEQFEKAGPIIRAELSTDAAFLVTVDTRALGTLWDLRNHRRLDELTRDDGEAHLLAIAPKGERIAWSDGHSVLLRSSEGVVRTSIAGGGTFLFTPAGNFLSANGSGNSEPVLYEVATGKPRRAKQIGHRSPIDFEAFAPDGATLATGNWDGSIILWSVPDLNRRGRLPTVSGHLRWLAFSPDGRTLAAAYENSLVRLWEVGSGMEFATLEGHTGGVYRACFSPDGRTLATYGHQPATDGFEMFLWHASPAN